MPRQGQERGEHHVKSGCRGEMGEPALSWCIARLEVPSFIRVVLHLRL